MILRMPRGLWWLRLVCVVWTVGWSGACIFGPCHPDSECCFGPTSINLTTDESLDLRGSETAPADVVLQLHASITDDEGLILEQVWLLDRTASGTYELSDRLSDAGSTYCSIEGQAEFSLRTDEGDILSDFEPVQVDVVWPDVVDIELWLGWNLTLGWWEWYA